MGTYPANIVGPVILVDANGNPIPLAGNVSVIAGKSTAAAPAYGEGTLNPFSTDLAGNVRTIIENPASQPVQVQSSFLAANIKTSTTTLVKSGAGVLHIVNVNAKGTVASTVKVYDGLDATGTLLATIDSLNLSGPFQYDVAFATGLTIVTTGTAAPDVTVSYR